MRIFKPAGGSVLPLQNLDKSVEVLKTQGELPVFWVWLNLKGPDARDFLHRLSTVNIKGLAVGEGAPGCFLTPQGKLRGSFQLWRDQEDSFSFEFDAGPDLRWKNEILTFIDQYTFSEKQTLTEGANLSCLWLFPSFIGEIKSALPSSASPNQTFLLDSAIRGCWQSEAEFSRPWLTLWGSERELETWVGGKFPEAASLTSNELELWRVKAMRPRAGFELVEGVSPLELGLRRSIADHKGCYPGQEVVERVMSMGAPARRLVQFEMQAGEVPAIGDLILDSATGLEAGGVTSVVVEKLASGESIALGLGLVKKAYAKEGGIIRFSSLSEKTGAIIQVAPYEMPTE